MPSVHVYVKISSVELLKTVYQLYPNRTVNENEEIRNMINEIEEGEEDECEIIEITEEDVEQSVKYASNWKAPGNDTIQGFYWKRLTGSRKIITRIFNEWLENPDQIPSEMTTGETTLIYKSQLLSYILAVN